MDHKIVYLRCFAAAVLIALSTIALAGGGSSRKDVSKDRSARNAKAPDCLEVCAQAILNGEPQKGVTIKLFCENEEVMKIDSTEFAKVYFTLKRDRYYTVEITKEGYVPRLVSISTHVPKSVPLKPIFRFEFEVEMLQEVKGQDNFFIDFPVALVAFNPSKDCFEHSKKYTTRIKREVAKENKASMAIKD